MRRYSPGPKLVEQRRYPEAVATSYSTEVCVVAPAGEGEALSMGALVPLAAAVRMMIPCAFRGSADLLDVAVCEVEGVEGHALVLFDRTAGSSGYARAVAEGGLADLLALARVALERLVGPVRHRLHRVHDTTFAPGLSAEEWDVGGALAWLDAVLDAPPEAAQQADDEEARGRRVEHVPGEGPGDLGRLWISSTGRADDLVWTRHRWTSAHPIGGQPAGPVFLDVAVERRTIAWAIRRAASAGASMHVAELDGGAWVTQHQAALSTASGDLVTLYEHLHRMAGARLPDTVLALVSAIPTHPHPLPPAERAPLAALARRRADRDAKVLLAWALLPAALKPTVRMTEAGPVLQITRNGTEAVVDLSGNAVRTLTGDTGGALALSWGEDRPPAEAAEAEDADGSTAS